MNNAMLTLIENANGPLTKRGYLENGKLKKDASRCRMSRGAGTRIEITCTSSAITEVLNKVGSNQALIVNDSTAYKGTIGTDPLPHTSVCWGEICFETNGSKGTITAFNPATMEHIANIPTSRKYNPSSLGGFFTSKHPGAPHILSDSALAGKKTHRYIYVIDVEKLEVIKQIEVGEAAVHPEFTARGAHLFVSSWGGNKVVVYDGFTYEKIKEIPAITPTSVLSSRRGDEHGV